jgi:hypothetical protein
MWLVYTLLITVSVTVLTGVAVAIYASAMIARPSPERKDRAAMLRGNDRPSLERIHNRHTQCVTRSTVLKFD